MAHPRWPGFDHKTGNPPFDNESRNLNLRMWRETKKKFTFSGPSGRKHKKHVMRIEGANYIKVIASVMNELARRDAK